MLGIHTEVKPVAGPGGSTLYLWKVVDFGRAIEEGVETSAAEAERVAGEALLARTQARRQKSIDKGSLRVQLKQLVHARPYLVAGVVELLILGRNKMGIMREAQSAEETWWSKEPAEDRKPIPSKDTGERKRGAPMKPASIRSVQLLELLEKLGYLPERNGLYDVRKVTAWADKMFGEGWMERVRARGESSAHAKKGGRR